MRKEWKKTMKKVCCFALTLCMAAGLCGCGGGSSDSESTTELEVMDGLKEINVVLDWYPNAVHSFIYDAIEKGYYEDEGLKVNIQFPTNTNDAMSLTAAGKAEVGIYYMQDVIMANANQDVPVKCIGSVCQKPLNIILSLKEKNITEPKDLVGKTIGYSGTELSETMVKAIMENAGVKADDVEMVDVGFDLMSSMTTGNVDATIGCMVNHEVPQMEKEGFEVNYFYPNDYGVPETYELVFVAGEDMIEGDAETLKAFLRASQKGFEDVKADPEGALDILLNNQNEENFPLDIDVETKSLEVLMPAMEPEGSTFLAQEDSAWEENIKWLKDQGLITKDVTPDDVRVDLINQ
ncbi:MAG: ABC transporter substrate-binding protein [Lachnospiraceae bacterium]|nr:ABC transporter substrate-binding protein [Lachnospiraceae bacterium]